MTLYGACVFLVVFGSLMLVLDAALLISTPFLLRRIEGISASRRATALLVFRLAPVVLSLVVLLGVFVPAWWRFEPEDSGETASVALLLAAAFAVLPVVVGAGRAVAMFCRTEVRLQFWRGRSEKTSTAHGSIELVEVRSEDLAFCVGGYLKPTIYASAHLMESLAPEEYSAALAHEVSHACTRDPLRLLWMAGCPDYLQLLGLDRRWRRSFSSACEFAADARATRGNPEVALDLASALLKVARLKTFRPLSTDLMADVALSSAFTNRVDLEARVQALANFAPADEPSVFRPWMLVTATLGFAAVSLLASEQAHILTEQLGRLLAP